MIANYEAFVKAYKVCDETWYALPKTTTADMSTDDTVGKEDIQDILNAIDSENSNIEVIDETSCPITRSGSVTVTKDGNKKTYTYDVTIHYSYTRNMTIQEDTLTISGTYELTETVSKAIANDEDVKCKFTINGTPYEIAYYQKGNATFTSASVNGVAIEVRLLNAPFNY